MIALSFAVGLLLGYGFSCARWAKADAAQASLLRLLIMRWKADDFDEVRFLVELRKVIAILEGKEE